MSLEKDNAQLRVELAETQMQLLEAQAMLVNSARATALADLAKFKQEEKDSNDNDIHSN